MFRMCQGDEKNPCNHDYLIMLENTNIYNVPNWVPASHISQSDFCFRCSFRHPQTFSWMHLKNPFKRYLTRGYSEHCRSISEQLFSTHSFKQAKPDEAFGDDEYLSLVFQDPPVTPSRFFVSKHRSSQGMTGRPWVFHGYSDELLADHHRDFQAPNGSAKEGE